MTGVRTILFTQFLLITKIAKGGTSHDKLMSKLRMSIFFCRALVGVRCYEISFYANTHFLGQTYNPCGLFFPNAPQRSMDISRTPKTGHVCQAIAFQSDP